MDKDFCWVGLNSDGSLAHRLMRVSHGPHPREQRLVPCIYPTRAMAKANHKKVKKAWVELA